MCSVTSHAPYSAGLMCKYRLAESEHAYKQHMALQMSWNGATQYAEQSGIQVEERSVLKQY